MIGLRALVGDGRRAVELGNALAPIERYLELLAGAGPVDRRILLAEIRWSLAHGATRLSPLVREALWARIGTLEPPLAAVDRTGLFATMDAVQEEEWGPGRVRALLVAAPTFDGHHYGLVPTLAVDAGRWGGRTYLRHRSRTELWNAFAAGAWAARDYVLGVAGSNAGLAQALYRRTVSGIFCGLGADFDVGGDSLALPAAVAAVSALLGLEAPRSVALTGALDSEGRTAPVGGLREKLSVAARQGLGSVLLPSANAAEADRIRARLGPELRIQPVPTLSAAMSALFAGTAVRSRAAQMAQTVDDDRAAAPGQDAPLPTGGLLLCCVGRADPVGQRIDRSNGETRTEDGPVLSLVRRLRPHHLALFYTTDEQRTGDYSANAASIGRIVEQFDRDCTTSSFPLNDVIDATDLGQLYSALGSAAARIIDRVEPENVVVNASSGTPQMQVVWRLLLEHRLLPPDTVMLQVRETQWLREGESPVRRMPPVHWPPGSG